MYKITITYSNSFYLKTMNTILNIVNIYYYCKYFFFENEIYSGNKNAI